MQNVDVWNNFIRLKTTARADDNFRLRMLDSRAQFTWCKTCKRKSQKFIVCHL